MLNNILEARKYSNIEYDLEWWNHANEMKNNGLYVDFISGQWNLPDRIKKSDYLQSYQIVGQLILLNTLLKSLELQTSPNNT